MGDPHGEGQSGMAVSMVGAVAKFAIGGGSAPGRYARKVALIGAICGLMTAAQAHGGAVVPAVIPAVVPAPVSAPDATAAVAAAATAGVAAAPVAPTMSFAFEARVTLAPAVEQGVIEGRRVRFIPITGGTVSGPRLNGTILPGGGDWQSIGSDGLTQVHARYAIRTDDGTVIGIDNPGVRVASAEVIARLTAGEDLDPSLYYFRTTPIFTVQPGPHEWLRRRVFVVRGVRHPDNVVLQFFEVN